MGRSVKSLVGIFFLLTAVVVTVVLARSAQNITKHAQEKVATSTTPVPLGTLPKQPAFRPGELIVKFKNPLSQGKNATAEPNSILNEFSGITLTPIISSPPKLRGVNILQVTDARGLQRLYKAKITGEGFAALRKKFALPTPPSVNGKPFPSPPISDEELFRYVLVRFRQYPNVEYAEPNYIVHAFDVTPNDPLFPQQWHLKNTGQGSGTAGDDIAAPTAWQTTTGSNQVIVAVVDTGVDYTHEDLSANILRDSQGQVVGYDFANRDNDPIDDNGHGTHVAGIIAGVGNNTKGVSGVCWSCKIMPIKFLGNTGSGTIDGAIPSIEYAVSHGARIISNSWGGGVYSQSLQDAINAAKDAGVLVVAAAGNDGANIRNSFPAVMDNVISVGATTNRDERAFFSNFGPGLDLTAPGYGIFSTFIPGKSLSPSCKDAGSGYGPCSGTSMATPVVAGVAAVIASQNPAQTLSELTTKLLLAVDDKGPGGWDDNFGLGRVNLQKGVTIPSQSRHLAAITTPSASKAIRSGITAIRGYALGDNFSSYELTIGIGEQPSSWQKEGTTLTNGGTQEVFGDTLGTVNLESYPFDILTLRLTVKDTSGLTTVSSIQLRHVAARTIYVNGGNTSGVEDGTTAHPFSTIQKGIDDAFSGDTIKVLAGTYRESPYINASDVVLSGDDRAHTIIAGNGDQYSVGIMVSGYPDSQSHITVENFTIQGFDTGILVSGPIKDVHVSNNTIKDIRTGGNGINLQMLVTNSVVEGNVVTGGYYGILENMFGNDHNVFTDNYLASAEFSGIYLHLETYNQTIENNLIVGNGVVGIALFSCFHTSVIRGNQIEKNGNAGIVFAGFCPDDAAVVTLNNFVNSPVPQAVFLPGHPMALTWLDNSRGNYWSNFDEPAEGAHDANSDGIVDEPYHIDGDYTDEFPLAYEHGSIAGTHHLYPTKALAGSRIMITGSNLGLGQSGNHVILNDKRINRIEAAIESWENDKIVFRLPDELFSGRYAVSTAISGNDPVDTGLILNVYHTATLVPSVSPIPTVPVVSTPTPLTFTIPPGTGQNPWNTQETMVQATVGQTLRIINDDDADHLVHVGPKGPCPHQPLTVNGHLYMHKGDYYDCVLSKPYDSTVSGPFGDHVYGDQPAFWLNIYDAAANPSPTLLPTPSTIPSSSPTPAPLGPTGTIGPTPGANRYRVLCTNSLFRRLLGTRCRLGPQ